MISTEYKLSYAFFLLGLILFASAVSAEITPTYVFKRLDAAQLSFTCFNEPAVDICSASFNCTATIFYPNTTIMVQESPATRISNYYNVSIPDTSVLGYHKYNFLCTDGSTGGQSQDQYFQINPTGEVQFSILNNPFLIIIFILGMALIIVGMSLGNTIFGFIGSMALMIGGIYSMLYGFGEYTNFYTRAVALFILGVGIIFMFVSAYETIKHEDEEED